MFRCGRLCCTRYRWYYAATERAHPMANIFPDPPQTFCSPRQTPPVSPPHLTLYRRTLPSPHPAKKYLKKNGLNARQVTPPAAASPADRPQGPGTRAQGLGEGEADSPAGAEAEVGLRGGGKGAVAVLSPDGTPSLR